MAYKKNMKRFKECKTKCPFCGIPFTTRDALYTHVESAHADELEEGITTAQSLFNLRQNRVGRRHGECRICKADTAWNEFSELYDQMCGKQSCKDEARKRVIKNLEKVYGEGVTTLADRASHQLKALRGRSIAGTLNFDNGEGKELPIWYIGSYEKDFLQMLRLIGYKYQDIMDEPPTVIKYIYEGEELFYIVDFYLPALNLMVEIKDGGDNPNNHHKIKSVDKVKEKAKHEAMLKQTMFNFIQIPNKQYGMFHNMVELLRNLALVEGVKKVKCRNNLVWIET